MHPLVVPHEYVYVLAVALASVVLGAWLNLSVCMARRRYKVPYPVQVPTEREQLPFLCAQRAQTHFHEVAPTFYVLLFTGGLRLPRTSALLGAVYVLGRLIWSLGYLSDEPGRRTRGSFYGAGLVGLLVGSIYSVVTILGE